MSIPTTKSRNAFRGDTVRIVTAPATDTHGRYWAKGRELTPLAGGFDNFLGCQYLTTTAGTRFESR